MKKTIEEKAIHKKEELAREYRLKAVLNTERYLEGGSNIEKAYIAGWDAAIENLWHENSEEPKIDSLVLVREGDTVYAARYVGLGGFNVSSDYREFSNYRWAYISDFLPYK